MRELVRKRSKAQYTISYKGKDAGFLVLQPTWEASDKKAVAAEEKKEEVPMDLGTNV